MTNIPYLIDVRTKQEWDENHIEASHHIPLDDMLDGKMPEVSKSAKIYVYCRSGNRAEQARFYLANHGYTSVINIKTVESARKLSSQ